MSDSDGDLLARCRSGNQAAWREMVELHHRRVFGLAYRYIGRVDEAEDLTQEVFVKVYQNLDRYRSEAGAFSTWVTTVARNHAIDHYRRRREERLRREGDETSLATFPSADDGPLRRLERQERVQLVRAGLRSLPEDLREAVILCDLQGLPYDEIAQVLGVPLGTVKSRINRGRMELARRLARRAGKTPGGQP